MGAVSDRDCLWPLDRPVLHSLASPSQARACVAAHTMRALPLPPRSTIPKACPTLTVRVIPADRLRNPTLSYTQRLEERIKDLEDQLSKSQSQALSQTQQHAPERPASTSFDGSHLGHESGEGLAGTFRGLKLDERGVLTYHGATSFFHLPSEYTGQETDAPSPPLSEDPMNGRRERLVNNAWQQRALEDLSEIPVSKPLNGSCAPGSPARARTPLVAESGG